MVLILYRWVVLGLALMPAVHVASEPINVFLLGGQSNMVGIRTDASLLPTAMQTPRSDIPFVYYQSQKTNIAPSGLFPGSGNSLTSFGPEVTFGHAVADRFTAERFAIIKSAVNATNLYFDWSLTPDTTGATKQGAAYTAFQQTVADGLAELVQQGYTPQIVGMLWTQGESDATADRTTAQYSADLTAFVADIRGRYGQDLPFFVSRLSTSQTNISAARLTAIRSAQESVAGSDEYVWLVDTDGLSVYTENPVDPVHFDSAGQIELGERFAQAYISTVPEPGSLVCQGLAALACVFRRKSISLCRSRS